MTRRLRGALALACLSFAACGFLGTEGVDGRPIADGLAPFDDEQTVLLCVDGARVTESARPPGLCRAEAHESAACDSDAQCEAPEACVCGKCTAKLCDFTSECPEGTVCSGNPRRCLLRCESDEQCGHLGVCESGTCLKACADQTECAVGELCLAARCRAIACGPSGPNCGPGEVCSHQLLSAEARGPSVVRDEEQRDQLVLFVGVQPEGSAGTAIYRFVSRDGIQFSAEPSAPVLSPDGSSAVSFEAPSAVRTDEGLRIFYEVDGGAAIGTALDATGAGTSFGPGEIALTPSEAWEAGRVGSPGATSLGDALILAYEGGDGEGIGMTLFEGGALTNASAPVLTPGDLEDSERFVDVTEVRDPFPLVVETRAGRRILRLYVAAAGIALPASPGGSFDVSNSSIAVAGAVFDGPLESLSLEPHTANPIFGRVQNFAPQEESGPSLIFHDRVHYLYFDSPAGIRRVANPAE